MPIHLARKAAQAFLDAYEDPDIDKRLFFAVWADREGLGAAQAKLVWTEVRRLTYRRAARERVAARRQGAARPQNLPQAEGDGRMAPALSAP